MKKCPFCSAELEDNASFCLYCMKSFDKKKSIAIFKAEKKNNWLIFLIIAIIIILLIFVALFKNHSVAKSKNERDNSSFAGYTSDNNVVFSNNSLTNAQTSDFHSSFNEDEKFKTSSENASAGKNEDNSSLFYENITTSKNTVISNQTGTSSRKPQSGSQQQNTTSQKTSSKVTTSNNSLTTTTSKTVTSSKPANVQKWGIREVSGGVEITEILVYESLGNYTVPSKINGKTVVGIGMYAFKYETIKSITLPETIKYIDDSAFSDVRELKSIVIPKSVNRLGTNAFMACKTLSEIYIKSTSIELGNYVFATMYQRYVDLTIYAPSEIIDYLRHNDMCDANYVEWNG